MDRKYHLVKWDKVCSNLREGGLCIKNLGLFNSALLGKWIWHFMVESNDLWKKVVVCKYGERKHKWFSNIVSESYGSGVWKGIRRGWELFERHISFDIGDGSKIRFWKDRWSGELELWRLFPSLFNLAVDKDCLVSSVLRVEEGSGVESCVSEKPSRPGIGVVCTFFC